LKILVITQYFYPENFRINEIIDYLLKKKDTIDVVAPFPNYPNKEYFEQNKFKNLKHKNLEIHRHNILKRSKKNSYLRVLNYLSYIFFSNIYLLKNKEIVKNSEVIISPLTSPITSAIPALIMSKIYKKNFVIIINDIWPETILVKSRILYSLTLKFFNFYIKYLYRNANKIFIQDKTFTPYVKRYNISNSKIFFLPNWSPVENNSFTNIKFDNKKINLIYLGNIGIAQDFNILFDFIKSNLNLFLSIVGDGTELNNIKKKVDKLNLNDRVIFYPYQSPKSFSKILHKSHFGIISLKDNTIAKITTPGKYQLYLSYNLPVIAFNIYSKKDEIIKNQIGFFCSNNNIDNMGKNLIKLKNKDYNKMRLNVKKLYKNYDKKLILDNFYNIINQ
tara:strand:- start:16764 stop:17933 length:1170 start_codon:yes stop_codon:yes gene_type:complete